MACSTTCYLLQGQTAIQYAVAYREYATVRRLLAHGADTSTTDIQASLYPIMFCLIACLRSSLDKNASSGIEIGRACMATPTC